ncbi:MAG: ATP-dependent metallopeptidase FtsH/Yme1/Tma family protein, partial [Planctomycetales bacterium]|nr:ATP-dependent metallopeptidase FtsH/Yme1/Tma family protein [Planctomycetales bacterium]
MAEKEPVPTNEPSPGESQGKSDGDPRRDTPPSRRRPFAPVGWTLIPLLLLVGLLFSQQFAAQRGEVTYRFFLDQLEQGNVDTVVIRGGVLVGEFVEAPPEPVESTEPKEDAKPTKEAEPKEGAAEDNTAEKPQEAAPESGAKPADSPSESPGEKAKDKAKQTADEPKKLPKEFFVTLPANEQAVSSLIEKLDEKKVQLTFRDPYPLSGIMTFLSFLLLIGLAVFMFSFMRRARDQMMGGGMLGNVTRSPARRYAPDSGLKVTFDDVAGLKGVKRDLKEIVEFLR